MYSEKVYELFDNLKNNGRVKGAEAVGQAEDGSSHDVVKIFMQIQNETVVDAKFKVCGSIASMIIADYAMDLIKNCTLTEVKALTLDKLTENFVNVRDFDTYSARIILSAIKQAVENYEEKQRKALIKQLKEEGKPIPEELKR